MQAGQSPTAASPPALATDIRTVFIDPGTYSGETSLHLRNDTRETLDLWLLAGGFLNAAGRDFPAHMTFLKAAETSGAPEVEATLQPGQHLSVRVQITEYREPGRSQGFIILNGVKQALTIEFLEVPFNIGITTPTPDKPRLSLMRNRSGSLALKNEDAIPYTLTYSILIPGDSVAQEDTATIPANSTTLVPLQPPSSWFSQPIEGLFKDEERDGFLSLRHLPPGAPNVPTVRARTIPVQLDLAYRSTFTRIVGYVVIALVLGAGALVSMVVNLWIPNYRRRTALLSRLDRLAADTRQISDAIDSRLRVGLRVERLRLEEDLSSFCVPRLDASEAFTRYETEVDLLSKRVEQVTALDTVTCSLNERRAHDVDAPPSVLEQVTKRLKEATYLLDKTLPSDDELEQAQSVTRAAAARLDQLGQDDVQLSKDLAARVSELHALYDERNGRIGVMPESGALRKALPTLFRNLTNPDNCDAAKIAQHSYYALDVATLTLQMLAEWVEHYDALSTARETLDKLRPAIVEQARGPTGRATKQLGLLVAQVREEVFAEDIPQALEHARIDWHPPAVSLNQPVRLRVRLLRDDHNSSRARDAFTCLWDFGEKVGPETGWEIRHYFAKEQVEDERVGVLARLWKRVRSRLARWIDRNRGDNKDTTDARVFKVHVKDENGQTLRVIAGNILLQPKHGSNRGSDASKVEIFRLALALLIALAGLVTVAYEQFMKLDIFFGLIAIFLLGFSADVIKNVFTKATT